MTSIGAIFLPQQPPERLRDVVRVAEQSGLDELWLWEDCFFESGIASAATALATTDRLRIGVGLLPMPLRNVALTAMELATLHRLFPGRPRIGVGHGVQTWMRQVGAAVDSPLTLLREYLAALRALLRGEELTTTGRYVNLDRVVLDWPPGPTPDVLAGATGPKSLRVCGELADGVILTASTTPDDVRSVRQLLAEARPDGADRLPITVYLMAATGDGAADRIARDVRDRVIDGASAAVAGDASAIADAVAALVDAGADDVVLQPTTTDPDPEAFVRFVAERVRPLVP